jgi:SAM-dependent methyltransferase
MGMMMVVKVAAAALLVGGGVLVWKFGYFAAPFAWTEEPQRLAAALGVSAGMTIADIGAGDGAMAVALAGVVGDGGLVFATELADAQRQDIAERAHSSGAGNLRVVVAGALDPGLPDSCCHAVYVRTVFHHVEEPAAFAAALARTVRPGGRIAVIDFAPGTLWFHGADHGVRQADVVAAFDGAGWRVRQRDDAWGGGLFLLVFERRNAASSGPS